MNSSLDIYNDFFISYFEEKILYVFVAYCVNIRTLYMTRFLVDAFNFKWKHSITVIQNFFINF